MNGKCGLTPLRKCHSHNTQELARAAESIKIRFGKTNDYFIEHLKINFRFKDKTVSLTKHLTIIARFLFSIFFMNSPFILPFPPTIIECIEALESIPSRGALLPATCGKGNTWDKYLIFKFKSYCSAEFNEDNR